MPVDFFLHTVLTTKTLQNLNLQHFFWMQAFIFLLMLGFCTSVVLFQHNIDYKTFNLKTKCFLNLILKQIKKSVKGVVL